MTKYKKRKLKNKINKDKLNLKERKTPNEKK